MLTWLVEGISVTCLYRNIIIHSLVICLGKRSHRDTTAKVMLRTSLSKNL